MPISLVCAESITLYPTKDTTLKDIVHFYNTRDIETWPGPEVELNINHTDMGNLKLRDVDEDAIVAFLKTLSDGYTPDPNER